MNKLLLLSHIKGLMFVLKSLLNMILILSTTEKVSELSFCSRFKMYVLMVSMLVFALKIIRPIIFSTVKKVTFLWKLFTKEVFHNQGIFPQLRKFSTVMGFFHNQGIFPQSRKFSTIKKFPASKDPKGSLKAKILGSFNTKSSATIFLAL